MMFFLSCKELPCNLALALQVDENGMFQLVGEQIFFSLVLILVIPKLPEGESNRFCFAYDSKD